ncbi:MAG TPA: LysR family transcriptional regulator ArgP [Spirochaetia bacterium]|nr:LysR family transcriptional regulator ArgP [Spirochaetia bacterium]
MIDYRLLEAFAAVIDLGGFERAADGLGLTQSAVSQRVKALEDEMGRMLVVRDAPPRPTPAGERLLRHYRQVVGLEADAASDLGLRDESGFRHLPVAVNADSLSVWFIEAVSPFLSEERVTLELLVDDQEQTLRFLRSGAAAGAISSEVQAVQGFRRVALGAIRYRLVATPGFCRRWFPAGFDRAAAGRAPVIHFNRADGLQLRALGQAFGEPRITPPAHYVPSSERLADAVRRGLGYAMMPELQAARELGDGLLVELDERCRLETPLHWYYWNRPSEPLERFTEALVSGSRRLLGP